MALNLLLILVADNPPQIDILNNSLFNKSSEELTTEDKMYIIKYGMHEWIEWEKQSKILYEDCYHSLVDISEVASAEFVMRFIKDVDHELKDAERIFRVREGINWNLDTIYDKQSRVGKR